MIQKMKRTKLAKHGWKVWIKQETLLDTTLKLGLILQRKGVWYKVDVQYGKHCVSIYTDDERNAKWIEEDLL